ncbi:adenosylmethionine decarboxylase [Sphingobium ummariense]
MLNDAALIEIALRSAAESAGATVIGLHLHHFGEEQGVTGVVLLAESHMSIHTWPEHGYAAADIFLCGARHDPAAALASLSEHLAPERMVKTEVKRGELAPPGAHHRR